MDRTTGAILSLSCELVTDAMRDRGRVITLLPASTNVFRTTVVPDGEWVTVIASGNSVDCVRSNDGLCRRPWREASRSRATACTAASSSSSFCPSGEGDDASEEGDNVAGGDFSAKVLSRTRSKGLFVVFCAPVRSSTSEITLETAVIADPRIGDTLRRSCTGSNVRLSPRIARIPPPRGQFSGESAGPSPHGGKSLNTGLGTSEGVESGPVGERRALSF
jgi:hypothetical protein